MKTTYHPFDTPPEAIAFLAGVDFINDSSVNAFISPNDPACVVTEDEDGELDPEDAEDADHYVLHATQRP